MLACVRVSALQESFQWFFLLLKIIDFESVSRRIFAEAENVKVPQAPNDTATDVDNVSRLLFVPATLVRPFSFRIPSDLIDYRKVLKSIAFLASQPANPIGLAASYEIQERTNKFCFRHVAVCSIVID
ncbi:unnamed protein product [Heligmosomoides polygyrus]|uniref:Uncharacterized protein n=1 Tax=Heligmosomoides polygyrus TaxID=6339 RepID=A0A183FK63_HELPZ|nr:unnamed protein product [Heligmosomoides polygyrus]